MKINIEVIPHSQQRYETVGDWIFNGEDLNMKVSSMNNWKYEFLVGLHEMIEAFLCKNEQISTKTVDEFDKKFEQDRKSGLHEDDEEPGDCSLAPYYRQHQLATVVERLICLELGLNWEEYGNCVMSL